LGCDNPTLIAYDQSCGIQPAPAAAEANSDEVTVQDTDIEGAVDAGEAMLYNTNGLFTNIDTTFNTSNGATLTRRRTPYLPVAAVQKTTDKFLFVSTDTTAHRIAFKE
jgi:hypothetical protein